MPAIPPSGPSPIQLPPLGSDPGGSLKWLFNLLKSQTDDPIRATIGREVSALIDDVPDSDYQRIEGIIQDYLNCPHPDQGPGDVLMYDAQLGLGNASAFMADLQSMISYLTENEWEPTILHTAMDDVFMNLAAWAPPSDVAGLYNTIRSQIYEHIGSSGSLLPYIQGLLGDPSFFINYPNVNSQDLTALLEQCSVPVPDYISEFLSLGYKSSYSPLEQTLLQEMASVWTTGNLQTLQQWFVGVISNPANFGLSSDDVTRLAQDINYTLPPSFLTYYNAMKELLPGDPNSADYQMIVNFQSQWINALLTQPDFQAWFRNNFGMPGEGYPPGVSDLYMRYPLAHESMIQAMVNVFFGGAYAETSLDSVFRTLYATHGSNSYGLEYNFFAECRAVGSGDNNQAIENWIDNLALAGFPEYATSPAGVSNVMSFLRDFPFTVTIGTSSFSYISEFIVGYIQEIWLKDPSRTAQDKKFGNQVVADILSHPTFTSFADLKTFIDGRIPTYQKLDPNGTVVIDFLKMFELYP